MPCTVRFNLIGVPQYVIQRGNNRESCSFSESGYIHYLEDLQVAAETTVLYPSNSQIFGK